MPDMRALMERRVMTNTPHARLRGYLNGNVSRFDNADLRAVLDQLDLATAVTRICVNCARTRPAGCREPWRGNV